MRTMAVVVAFILGQDLLEGRVLISSLVCRLPGYSVRKFVHGHQGSAVHARRTAQGGSAAQGRKRLFLSGKMFGVSRTTLFRWQQKYDAGGPRALETKKAPGPASRLSPQQLGMVFSWVTGSNPGQLQFEFALWTRKIVRDLEAYS